MFSNQPMETRPPIRLAPNCGVWSIPTAHRALAIQIASSSTVSTVHPHLIVLRRRRRMVDSIAWR